MLVIKIELWPCGDEELKREIGRAEIWNEGTGDRIKGNYGVKLFHTGKYKNKKGFWKEGKVKNHLRSLSPYHLVMKAFQNALNK